MHTTESMATQELSDHDKLTEIVVTVRNLTDKVDNFLAALSNKVDKESFHDLKSRVSLYEGKVDEHEKWIGNQKERQTTVKELDERKLVTIGILVSLLASLSSGVLVFILKVVFHI